MTSVRAWQATSSSLPSQSNALTTAQGARYPAPCTLYPLPVCTARGASYAILTCHQANRGHSSETAAGGGCGGGAWLRLKPGNMYVIILAAAAVADGADCSCRCHLLCCFCTCLLAASETERGINEKLFQLALSATQFSSFCLAKIRVCFSLASTSSSYTTSRHTHTHTYRPAHTCTLWHPLTASLCLLFKQRKLVFSLWSRFCRAAFVLPVAFNVK